MSIESLPEADQWLWSDGELAAASGSGCPLALSEIYRRYYVRLVRVCQVRVHERQLAEDIAQTTMLRAMRYLPGFDADRPLWPWLRVIALRQCASVERKRRCEVSLDEHVDLFEPASDPCEKLLQSLSLNRALAALPARQRMALELRYLEDLGNDEAATIIGVNRNAFDQLLARGRTKLAAAFSADNAVHGFGLIAVLGTLRRLGRRASDTGSSGGSAAAPIMGASLAAAAGVAAMFSLHVGSPQGVEAPRPDTAHVVSIQLQTPVVASVASAPALRTSRAPVTRPAAAVDKPMLRTQVEPHGLSGGKVAADRLVIPTPVGDVNMGGELVQSPGGASVCAALALAAAGPHC